MSLIFTNTELSASVLYSYNRIPRLRNSWGIEFHFLRIPEPGNSNNKELASDKGLVVVVQHTERYYMVKAKGKQCTQKVESTPVKTALICYKGRKTTWPPVLLKFLTLHIVSVSLSQPEWRNMNKHTNLSSSSSFIKKKLYYNSFSYILFHWWTFTNALLCIS